MVRIGGPGPMIPPQVSSAAGAQKAERSGAEKASETAAVHQGTEAARTQQAKKTQQSALTGRAKQIAKRLSEGQLTQKEATREFVKLVIEERFPAFKKKRKKKRGDAEPDLDEQLEEAVTELIDKDPALAKRLKHQFQALSKD